jgi:hypothetical protein
MRRWRQMRQRVLNGASILALAWGAWWTFFGIASGIGEGIGALGTVMHTLPGLLFLAAAVIARRWNLPGGILLVAVGIGALWFFGYLPSRLLSITALLLGLPPLVSGVVFMEAGLRESIG